MKRVLFLYFILSVYASQLLAQTNQFHTFPESSIWRVDLHFVPHAQSNCFINYYFQYYIDGDTIINSQLHKKIYSSGIETDTISCSSGGAWPTLPTPGYIGAILEDSILNKVFFVFKNSSIDSLLLDYNLDIGDTLQGCLTNSLFAFDPVQVLSIDSIQIMGSYRKVWHFSPSNLPWNYEPYIIQGVGSSIGLMDPIYTYGSDFSARDLICLRDGPTLIHSTNISSNFGCTLVSNEEVLSSNDISCFPNPAENNITFELSLQNSITFEMYSTTGTLLIRNDYKNSPFTISRNGLPSGLYFYRIISGGGEIYTGMVVFE